MKKIFKIVGIILLIIAAIAGYGAYKYFNVEKETSAMITNIVETVSTSWNPQELQKVLHPLFLESIQPPNPPLDKYFSIYQKLGPLKGHATCTLLNVNSNVGPTYTQANYLCNATFENGKADIAIDIRQDGATKPWLVISFNVNSPVFMEILGK